MAKRKKKSTRASVVTASAPGFIPGGPSGSAELEALDAVAPPPYVPPRFATLIALAFVVVTAGFFARQGFARLATADGRLSERLLEVRSKEERPIAFDLPHLDGTNRSLGSLAGPGKVVFINFWATWCPPCVEEMPSLRRLARRMADESSFAMLAVSTDDDWRPVRQFFERESAPFDVLLDASGKVARQYGTEKFPETYIIANDQLVGYVVGPRDWDTWYAEAYLRALVGQGRRWAE